jgi:tetratricopeptide (TPR) repeat protein
MNRNYIKYHFIFLLFVALPCITHAQASKNSPGQHVIDSLKGSLNKEQDDSNKVKSLLLLSSKFLGVSNYDSALMYAKHAQTLAEKVEFKKGIVSSLMNVGAIYTSQGNYPPALQNDLKALELAQEIGEKKVVAGALGNIGNIYFAQGDYPRTLDYCLKALAVTEEMGNKSGSALHLGNIGLVYYSQGNYPKALEYELKALTLTQEIGDKDGEAFNLSYIANIYTDEMNYQKALEYYIKALDISQELGDKESAANDLDNMGTIYNEQGNTSKALEYYLKSLTISNEIGEKEITISDLNLLGGVYNEQGNFPMAIEYHLKALTIAREIKATPNISDIYYGLGEVYTNEKNYKLSKTYLDSALTLAQNIGNKKEEQNAYSAMTLLDSATGNYKSAFEDYRKYIVYRDSITNKESVEKITQLGVSYEFQTREDSIKAAQEKTDIIKTAESNRKTIITWSAVVILLLVLVLGLLFINRQQIKHRNDKIISEKEKSLLKLEKQKVEDELINAKTLLDEYVKNIVQKNTLLEEFGHELEELKNLKSREIDEKRIEHLESLNKAPILTEEDWNKFKQLFEQVYKGFFIRLKEKLPDLTQAEIRLICLTKLNLETKQMAGILGVSYTTIKQTRYRLRKKLSLPEEDNIDVILESI